MAIGIAWVVLEDRLNTVLGYSASQMDLNLPGKSLHSTRKDSNAAIPSWFALLNWCCHSYRREKLEEVVSTHVEWEIRLYQTTAETLVLKKMLNK